MKYEIDREQSGIPGFDTLSCGGFLKGKVTLVAGTTGSGKTIFSAQFLKAGVENNQAVVFVTFEEPAGDLRSSLRAFGWDIADYEARNLWKFVDCSPKAEESHTEFAGDGYDLSGLLSRIEHAVKTVNAQRVVIDSLNALLMRYSDSRYVRNDMLQLALLLRKLGVTSLVTTERSEEYGPVTENRMIEFIVDCVVVLRNVLENEKRRRTVEILKYRGGMHNKGEFPFGILADRGIVAHSLGGISLSQRSSTRRISCGVPDLDAMCDGGFFQDSVVVVAGSTGTGKTLIASQFLAANSESGDRRLLIGFEESRDQLFRNAASWGMDFENLEKEGLLKVHCVYPEIKGIEEHLLDIHHLIEEFKPKRVVVDSLSAIRRAGSDRGFKEFIISCTAMLKKQEICAVYTATTPNLVGATMIADGDISTIADSIILLRYVELFGKLRRGLAVIKMRGSRHDMDVRQIEIDSQGMHLGAPFDVIGGVLSGQPIVKAEGV